MHDGCSGRRAIAVLALLACCSACATAARVKPAATAAAAAPLPVVSPAQDAAAAGLVDIHLQAPDLRTDIRYAGSRNFVGKPIDGYDAPKCLLLRPVAEALARVEHALRQRQQRLLVYDCYRPVRAVAHFMRWAADPRALSGKAEFFPTIDKSAVVPQYIAERSGHSRGATLDVTLLQCDARNESCTPLDMGTPFDWFSERAHTDSPSISVAQRANRHTLRDAMAREGFVNYADEWWHFTLQPEPMPMTAFDVPIR